MKLTHALVASATILAAGLAASGAAASASTTEPPSRSVSKLATPVGDHSERWAGTDRYATAVEISRSAGWDEGNATVVYLATGLNYPDALALGASAEGGPILFVKPGDMTDVTRSEIRRLTPCFIVAVGGSDVVSDAVVREADSYTMAPTQDKCSAPAQ